MRQAIPADAIRLLRDALQRGQLTGTSRFVDEVEQIIGLRIEQQGQGRPRILENDPATRPIRILNPAINSVMAIELRRMSCCVLMAICALLGGQSCKGTAARQPLQPP